MARFQGTDGLHTSVSQLKLWLRCPRQFELKYVRGITAAFVPVSLAFGSAVHVALAAHYSELRTTGVPLRRDLLLDVFRDAWEKFTDGDIPLQQDEDADDPTDRVDQGVSVLDAFAAEAARARRFTVEAVELPFTVPLHDPDSGESLEEALTGVLDLVIRERSRRRRTVVEHKTAARRWSEEQIHHDLQLSAYKLAARAAGMGEVALRLQVLTKTKTPAFQVAEVTRDRDAEADLVRTAVGVLRAIDAGVSFPVRSWACRSCPFAHACRSQ